MSHQNRKKMGTLSGVGWGAPAGLRCLGSLPGFSFLKLGRGPSALDASGQAVIFEAG